MVKHRNIPGIVAPSLTTFFRTTTKQPTQPLVQFSPPRPQAPARHTSPILNSPPVRPPVLYLPASSSSWTRPHLRAAGSDLTSDFTSRHLLFFFLIAAGPRPFVADKPQGCLPPPHPWCSAHISRLNPARHERRREEDARHLAQD